MRLKIFYLAIIVTISSFNVYGKELDKIRPIEDVIKVWSDNKIDHHKKVSMLEQGKQYKGMVEIAYVVVRNVGGEDIAFVTSQKIYNPRGGYPICYELSFKSKNIADAKKIVPGQSIEITGRFAGYDFHDSGYTNICSTHIAIFENANIIYN